MPKRLSDDEFKHRLQIQSKGTITVSGKYISQSHRLKFKCLVCKHTWTRYSRYDSGCPVCNKAGEAKRKTHKQYAAEVRAKFPELRVLDKYVDWDTELRHRCTKCREVWEATPNTTLNQKHLPCCTPYHNKQVTHKQYLEELRSIRSPLKPLEKYKGRFYKILHVCTTCNTEDYYQPGHVHRGHGCFTCAKDNSTYKHYDVEIDDRVYTVQGYERFALEYMFDRGLASRNLAVSVDEGKPTLIYVESGKERRYIPDFYVRNKNRIVEVKSLWTLGLTKGSPLQRFKNAVLKSEACIEQGYEFTLLAFNSRGDRITLPKDWNDWSRKDLARFVQGFPR